MTGPDYSAPIRPFSQAGPGARGRGRGRGGRGARGGRGRGRGSQSGTTRVTCPVDKVGFGPRSTTVKCSNCHVMLHTRCAPAGVCQDCQEPCPDAPLPQPQQPPLPPAPPTTAPLISGSFLANQDEMLLQEDHDTTTNSKPSFSSSWPQFDGRMESLGLKRSETQPFTPADGNCGIHGKNIYCKLK